MLIKQEKFHFERSNRVSQNPAILLKNKARQSKTKTRFSYDVQIKISVFSGLQVPFEKSKETKNKYNKSFFLNFFFKFF